MGAVPFGVASDLSSSRSDFSVAAVVRDFSEKFDSVGIVTGDVSIRQESQCLIMTTEILRSMLYRGDDMLRSVDWVIFDEGEWVLACINGENYSCVRCILTV